MVVGDQALTWYGAFRQLMTEVIDETCRTIPPHATRGRTLSPCPRLCVWVYTCTHYIHVMRSLSCSGAAKGEGEND